MRHSIRRASRRPAGKRQLCARAGKSALVTKLKASDREAVLSYIHMYLSKLIELHGDLHP